MDRKSRLSIFDNIHLLKDIELKRFLTDEDFEGLARELSIDSNLREGFVFNPNSKNKINNILFDKSYFILKILKTSIEKLNEADKKSLAKGLDWVTFEIHDSLLVKSEDKTLQKLEKMKHGNQELESIFNWLEEYSTIKQKQKDDIDTVINGEGHHGIDPEDPDVLKKSSILDLKEETIATIELPQFNIFQLESEVGKENTLSTVSCYIFITLGLYSVISYSHFENFLHSIAKGYTRNNSYHNDLHAADVEQTCYLYLKFGDVIEKLKLLNLDIAAFLISAIIHDYKHPGVTNGFLINSKSEIAIRYNDQSVLENFHIAESFKLMLTDEKCNIMSELTPEEYKLFRRRIIECVLATDLTFHTKQYSYIKAKKEKFSIEGGKNTTYVFEGLDNFNLFSTQQEFLNILLHTGDISNPTKPLEVYEQWVDRVMTEFWLQGDKEKELKLPISFLCDRNTTSIPKAQIGFIDGIVMPLLTTVVDFFPGLNFLLDNCANNRDHYLKLKADDEAKEKGK